MLFVNPFIRAEIADAVAVLDAPPIAGVPGCTLTVVSRRSETKGERRETDGRTIVDHVTRDKTARGERTHQRQFSGHHSRTNDPRELLSVLSRIRRMRSTNTENVEHRSLR